MLFIVLIFGIVSAQTPLPPMWPDVFFQDFAEVTTNPVAGVHRNVGSYYYNWTMKAYKIERSNGRYDRFCGLSGPHISQDTPCTHLVVNGNRYLYYPELNQCCYCCNSTSGCGVLFPGWMQDSTYIDTEIHNGVLTYKWFKQGNEENFFWETTGGVPTNRVTIAINQVTEDDMDFGPRSSTFPADAFNLPGICTLSTTCNWGFCQELRNGEIQFEEYLYI